MAKDKKRMTADELLKFDPLLEVEKITGKSYKDPEATALGFLLMHAHSDRKQEVLSQNQDTFWGMSPSWLKGVCEDLGLKLRYEEPIPETKDVFYLYAGNGLVVYGDTYGGNDRLNSVSLCGIYKPNLKDDGWWREATTRCSGGPVTSNDLYPFSYDGREGLKNKVQKLLAHGTFESPWTEKPCMFYLVTYKEWHDKPKVDLVGRWSDRTHDARLARLPEDVQAMVGPLAKRIPELKAGGLLSEEEFQSFVERQEKK